MAVVDNTWKIDRHFDYNSVNVYYINKIKSFQTDDIPNLPITMFETQEDLGKHLKSVASELGIELTPCDFENMYLWGSYLTSQPAEKHANIWKYREYVFGCGVLFVAHMIEKAQANNKIFVILNKSTPRAIPGEFDINDHTFTVIGSSELMSDIDVTIQGPHASLLISAIEDLLISLTINQNIPIRCWDLEFYGDFKLLNYVFINFSKFNNIQRMILLKYALVSYFRSTHQVDNKTPVVHPNVTYLVRACLRQIGVDEKLYENTVSAAYDFWVKTAPMGILDREYFYKQLINVESKSETIIMIRNAFGAAVSNNDTMRSSGIDVDSLAFNLFDSIAQGNIHRAESYVLPSTAVHVVEFEQKKVGKSSGGLPESWFSSNARIGIDIFGFMLSAIEQLGYLEHYHPKDELCSKKGIKYFGRYVRALIQAGLLQEGDVFTSIYKELNIFRSTKGAVCNYDVHKLLNQIQSKLHKSSGGGMRRTRRRHRVRHQLT